MSYILTEEEEALVKWLEQPVSDHHVHAIHGKMMKMAAALIRRLQQTIKELESDKEAMGEVIMEWSKE